jgi:hypothetical protein
MCADSNEEAVLRPITTTIEREWLAEIIAGATSNSRVSIISRRLRSAADGSECFKEKGCYSKNSGNWYTGQQYEGNDGRVAFQSYVEIGVA